MVIISGYSPNEIVKNGPFLNYPGVLILRPLYAFPQKQRQEKPVRIT
jgi:hypothetical protein